MEVERAIIYLFFLSMIILLLKIFKRPSNYPPGPRCWPFIGYICKAMIKNSEGKTVYFYEQMSNLAKIYGSVIGVYLGPFSLPAIFVCGSEAVKEALTNSDLDGRLSTPLIRSRTAGYGLGYMYASGIIYKQQRRFFLKHLRDLGYGKSSSEPIIQHEILRLLEKLMPEEGNQETIVNFKHIFRQHTLNIIWTFLTGNSFDEDHSNFMESSRSNKLELRSLNVFTSSTLPIPGPILRILPKKVIKRLGLYSEGYKPLSQLILSIIENRMHSQMKYGDNFIDIYMEEIKRKKDEGNSDNSFTINQLVANLVDLFEASSDTTENAIGWFLLYMIHYPEVQARIQQELDEVCGDGPPLLEHRSRLNYTEACLMEVQRLHNVAPFTLPHLALKDTKIQGYSIPKNSMVTMSLYSVHNDSHYWPEPHVFLPERHLSLNRELKKERNIFMPFGIGGRTCLGDSIARQMYFLFSASILKSFSIRAIPDEPLPTLSPYYAGGFLFYKFFKAIVVPRLSKIKAK